MKFLKSWLQDYIVEPLPSDEEIRDILNKKAFEVEEVVSLKKDTVFEIKVLPNRAHDALGHRGMARELCADFGFTFKDDEKVKLNEKLVDKKVPVPEIMVTDEKACTRFMSMRIEGVKVSPSPKWLKERLEAIGQRSINNIVDITNYVQFSLNKPMHAYDARKITGVINVRFAKSGEKLETLDGKDLKLNSKDLVIADGEIILGLAGIKGGKPSGIEEDTNVVILESANFEPSLIRRTSTKYNLHTDASKRFENGIANSLVEEGLYMTANLIKQVCKSAKASEVVDIYPKKDKSFKIGISKEDLNSILGTKYEGSLIEDAFKKLLFTFEKVVPEEKIKELIPVALDKPYERLASTLYDAPEKFSCGSLVNWFYVECGYALPRVSLDMYVYSKKIKKEDLKLGDLIFTNTLTEKPKNAMIYSKVLGKEIPDVPKYTKTLEFLRGTEFPPGIDHVGMYIGDGKVIHTGSIIGKVVIEEFSSSNYFKNECWYGRPVNDLKIPQFVIKVPSERFDIRIKEDLAEEAGRIIGYDKIVPTLPSLSRTGLLNKQMHYENKIREILFSHGFSEIITYTFGDVGEVELVKGLAKDKEKIRPDLGKGIMNAFNMNFYNSPLLGQKTIKVFEIGKVFNKESERKHLSIAIDDGAKKSNFSEEVDLILAGIKRTLGIKAINCETVSSKPYIIEIDLDDLIVDLNDPITYEAPSFSRLPLVSYKPVSAYPFIARDIAMWVPDSVSWESVRSLLDEIRNPIVARIDLFDTFSKEIEGVKKTSYAFRLVFQSHERTLTDEEVNKMIEEYYAKFKEKGYEIR
ncbi:MAG: Phenylalanine--tRNA ligase [Candidatus Nomurabacteria bacterium]|nr:Phenylalanine--tRNA ligase [Candidatus Nomurabacteria bacterium]